MTRLSKELSSGEKGSRTANPRKMKKRLWATVRRPFSITVLAGTAEADVRAGNTATHQRDHPVEL